MSHDASASRVNGSISPHQEQGTFLDTMSSQIILYTSHECPYAHRIHIALAAGNIPYKEVPIDITVPREAWYLEVNTVRP